MKVLAQYPQDDEYDVIVVGAGGAGMTAALCAAISGARVLLIESTEYVGGTTAYSAGTTWIPCTSHTKAVGGDDCPERARTYLQAVVGDESTGALRDAFLDAGPKAVAFLEAHSQVQFRARPYHPDYQSELEGATVRGRALEPLPFDGRTLGRAFSLVRPPIPEFTVLGGMMVDKDDIGHLLKMTRSFRSLAHSIKIVGRHAVDRMGQPRGTRLVMGNALVGRLLGSLLDRKVSILVRARVEELHSDARGVSGVTVSQDGTRRRIAAKGGVVLASGGFNRHPTRRQTMLPDIKEEWCACAPGATGAAQDLAIKAGAQYGKGTTTSAFWAPVSLRKRADGSTAVFPHFLMDRGKPGTLVVDRAGRRFVNEAISYHRFGLAMQSQKDRETVPAFLLTDAVGLRKYGLGMVRPGGKGLAPFLADGYLIKGDDLASLAERLNVDARTLSETVAEMNANAANGMDPQFHRGETEYQRFNGDASAGFKNPCLGTMGTAPYYAVRLYPGDIGAATGLVTDEAGRVLGEGRTPIPGLYACGNDMQSVMGGTYPGPGVTIGPALTFAYLAAKDAVGRIDEVAMTQPAPYASAA
ncbi:FAD-dependent oxidoreductase [Pararobbsia alpina]|uniref:3-oxosteroid 1-dehydrogenase n=1 Tax=Pararobbsia alpina TaxID=621374 RepID=A0A6S7BDF2_9BURK|nr:FAD-dependent oxidoreductase [Pararobbsia alpina]CAB3796239.1 3-oxosteroid 1-dehydrogenase [Pararobbsia alpina]